MSKEAWNHILTYKEEVVAGRTIMDIWSIEDVEFQAERLDISITNDETKEILYKMSNIDAEVGINWKVIEFYLYQLERENNE